MHKIALKRQVVTKEKTSRVTKLRENQQDGCIIILIMLTLFLLVMLLAMLPVIAASCAFMTL